ncbi:hypothetical protein VOLCADRAFT_121000 [Volvox carteri f. nagariensis]|uniref:Ribosome biogenesis protein NOP53 n=1 Tax=Volvox carteri f. nagariensis TaxID=3068 RepID=D8TZA8_VOLCA|nr:uncharacterized protein VOLCADRAFT_121000 [Volvox carteri f. nagariensis]EFJ47243.1 hypothetical protein VOLCADRAFT_121000 [Volvox carteri f. nagariensis]|eukprot:XP_002951792.1 hypothetical protein VOLCADRAFT_121000 [Volvox carteri f. nagariensis]
MRKKVGKKERKAAAAESEAAAAAAAAAVRAMGPSVKALRKAASSPPPPRVAAVAVDIPGCSFNPDGEQHQDALAVLVASEMRKQLRRELLPSAPPEEVEADGGEGRPLTELEALQVEAASSGDEEEEEEEAAKTKAGKAVLAAAAADPNAIALAAEGESDGGGEDGGEGGGGAENGGAGGAGVLGKRSRKSEKKSRKDRNKEARRKAAEAEAEERRRLKAQRRQLQSLQEVEAELEEERQDKEVRRLRRAVMLQERAAVQPPRLGKLKFEPPSVQVLTSDEKTGSLRRVVPCAMLAADRFKSLQQRGLLEPRRPQPFKERRRKVTYEKGARSELAAAASSEVRDLALRNKKARRQAKAAATRAGGEDDWL